MLQLKGVSAGYGNLKVLHDVDLIVPDGRIVALIGPNGAGKSTVIKSVFSIARQYSGTITWNRKTITDFRTHQLLKQGIAYIPQGRIVFGTLTVEENLEIGYNGNDKMQLQRRLRAMYKRFPVLKRKRYAYAFTLSGGQQQMLAIARALMTKPKLLLMDEPSLGLSPKLQTELFALIRKLRDQGLSILIVEQNARAAIQNADTTYLLEQGKVVLAGGKEILEDPRIKRVYLGGT